MARIHELLAQLRTSAPVLAADIEREVDVLSDRRAFGLNFERHTPEAVELPGRKVRVGDKVRVQPPRGEMLTVASRSLYRVTAIERDGARRVAVLSELGPEVNADELGLRTVDVEDVVVVAEFRDPIYPGLTSTGKVERGGDKPFHSIINAENFHALQTLLFTHRGQVDAIYIDPPYNTGAKDWKYNNDYVEADDLYRHSKWLAFIERRLMLAKDLLNPADSVLIATIDEKEYLRLGLLLEQTFPEARIQMITSVINPSGSSRLDLFSRSDEYIFFVFIGSARVSPTTDDMLNESSATPRFDVRWDSLRRRGNASRRSRIPSLFYPLYFSSATGQFDHAGRPLPAGQSEAAVIEGLDAVLPITEDGAEMTWSLSPEGFADRLAKGYVRYYKDGSGTYVIRFIQEGTMRAIDAGEVVANGTDSYGFPRWVFSTARRMTPMTTWKRASHSASDYATPMLTAMLPWGREFPYPKSLYAVEDALRFAVGAKKNALVVDFFSGSGTTAHAVMRLNKQDGGRRLAISVTNNEVGAEKQFELRKANLRPADPEWERWGICDYVTKPRIQACVTGLTPSGVPISGDYAFTDVFPMAEGFEENVEFFTLTYEAPMRVQSNREFRQIAPFLWLRAGSRGRRIESLNAGWDVAHTYGVLADLDRTEDFLAAMSANPEAQFAFIVTDEDRLFQAVVRDLPPDVEPIRMYESYLRNFEIDAMRSVR
jgi:adenine-specific DNA-methyltransferase